MNDVSAWSRQAEGDVITASLIATLDVGELLQLYCKEKNSANGYETWSHDRFSTSILGAGGNLYKYKILR